MTRGELAILAYVACLWWAVVAQAVVGVEPRPMRGFERAPLPDLGPDRPEPPPLYADDEDVAS